MIDRKSFSEIRNSIQRALAKRPMGLNEIANDCRLTIRTAKKHLEYLESLGVVERTVFRPKGKDIVLYKLRR